MAVYVATYTNNLGQKVDLRIEDIDDVNEDTIQLADNPITVTYSVKDEDDIFSPIMTGRAEVRVMLLDDSVSTEFFEAMSNAGEGEYKLRVHTHNGAGTTYGLYNGVVVPDGMQRGISYFNDIIVIKAVDAIERAKSFTLKKIDGTQFVGRFKLKEYIDAILLPIGAFTGEIYTDMTLTNTPASPLPSTSLLEQLWLDASVFNDSNGRPINAYDALEMIVFALGCRATLDHLSGIATLVMYEIISYPVQRPAALDIGIKGYLDREDNFLIGNQEVVTRIKTFKEVKGEFSYEGADGIVENGAMQFYDVDGKPQNVDVNAPLLALPDMNVRKRGNGRTENPYGFMLRSSYTEDTPGNIATRHISTVDMLAFKTPADLHLPRYSEIEISVTARLEDVGYVAEQTDSVGTNLQYTAMIVDAIVYNEADPANSVRSMLNPEGVPTWETVDLSGNASFASGSYDFSVNGRTNGLFAIFPSGSLYALGPIVGASAFISQYGTPLEFSATYNVSQTQQIELAPLPVSGRLHIAISQILDAGPMISHGTLAELNASTEMNTRIEGVLVSAKGLSEGKTESVYITRYGDHTTDKKEFEIKLNTTATPTAKGSLWTDVTYEDSNSKVGRFYRGPGWLRGVQGAYFTPSERIRRYITLVQYGALVRMAFNGVQNKLDFSVKASSLPPDQLIKFVDLVNISRESTLLYGYHHIQQMQKWNVTTGEREITAISMQLYNRDVEDGTEQDTPTPTTDVMEKYYQ